MLQQALAEQLGLRSDVFVRNGEALDGVVAANPFTDAARDRPSFLVVSFCREALDPASLDLLANYAGPERVALVGRELYIDFPEGQARSELPKAMAKARFPMPTSTARNWNTVRKLQAAVRD